MEFAKTVPSGPMTPTSWREVGVFLFSAVVRRAWMNQYLIMATGAVLGAFCRYWMGLWAADKFGTHFVTGTLLINLIGSFVLGLFLTLHLDRNYFTPNARFFVAVGWCAS